MRTTVRQALLLASKDIRVFFKDRFAVGFAFLFPFVFVIGFSLALGGRGPSDERMEFVVSTQESEGKSVFILREMSESSGGAVRTMDYDEAMRAVEDGDLEGFVTFPADFTESLVSGAPTELEVVVTGESPDAAAALHGFARSIAGDISEDGIVLGAISGLTGAAPVSATGGGPDLGAITFEIERVGDVEPFNASNFTLPGYLTMFVFFAAAMSAEAIARERRTHTLERLMSNGARRESIILGKFTGAATIGLMQVTLLWSVGVAAFGIDLGVSPVAVALISALMALASAAFGVLLASFVGDVKSASAAGVLASLILAPLGGCWWPLFITPEWMQSLAKITPHGWANTGFNKLMLFGAEFGDVTQEMAALAGFALAFLLVAVWRFRTSSA